MRFCLLCPGHRVGDELAFGVLSTVPSIACTRLTLLTLGACADFQMHVTTD